VLHSSSADKPESVWPLAQIKTQSKESSNLALGRARSSWPAALPIRLALREAQGAIYAAIQATSFG